MRVIELKHLGADPEKLKSQFAKNELSEQEANEIARKNLWVNYKDTMINALSSPVGGQREIGVADMRTAIKIMDKIEAANGRVHLEDAEYQFLNDRVQNMKWTLAHKHIMQFIDDIAQAPTVEIDAGKVTPIKPKK